MIADEQVEVPVVVDVPERRAHAVTGVAQAGFGGAIDETSIALLRVEAIVQFGCASVPPTGLDEINVEVAVAVVIEQRQAGAHDLRHEEIPVEPGVVDEGQAALVGHVGEARLRLLRRRRCRRFLVASVLARGRQTEDDNSRECGGGSPGKFMHDESRLPCCLRNLLPDRNRGLLHVGGPNRTLRHLAMFPPGPAPADHSTDEMIFVPVTRVVIW